VSCSPCAFNNSHLFTSLQRPTPFEPSVYPGAGCRRICTVARFLILGSKKKLTVLNTHLDHVSDDQRRYSASLLLIRGRYEAAISGGPVFLMGDFNSSPSGDDSGAYRITTGKASPVQVDSKFVEKYTPEGNQHPDFTFLDTRAETPRLKVSANFATFIGWSPSVTTHWLAIDFVFGGSNRSWYVL